MPVKRSDLHPRWGFMTSCRSYEHGQLQAPRYVGAFIPNRASGALQFNVFVLPCCSGEALQYSDRTRTRPFSPSASLSVTTPHLAKGHYYFTLCLLGVAVTYCVSAANCDRECQVMLLGLHREHMQLLTKHETQVSTLDSGVPSLECSECQFPFTYAQESYSECITKDSGTGQPWCYPRDSSKGWGYCANDCAAWGRAGLRRAKQHEEAERIRAEIDEPDGKAGASVEQMRLEQRKRHRRRNAALQKRLMQVFKHVARHVYRHVFRSA